MGFGDVRLTVLLGTVLGYSAGSIRPLGVVALVAICLGLAAVVGIVVGVVAIGARGLKAKVPFGPSLVIATYVCCLYADSISRGFSLR